MPKKKKKKKSKKTQTGQNLVMGPNSSTKLLRPLTVLTKVKVAVTLERMNIFFHI